MITAAGAPADNSDISSADLRYEVSFGIFLFLLLSQNIQLQCVPQIFPINCGTVVKKGMSSSMAEVRTVTAKGKS